MTSIGIGLVAGVLLAPAAADGKPAPGAVKTFTYKKTPQGELSVHVHFPADWKESDRRPAIVFFFGGGWNAGRVAQFEPQAEYLAGRGMVAARADYRVKSRHNVTPRECVEDAKSAVRWLRKNAGMLGIDPGRVVGCGGSAGGHIAACTGLCPGLDAEGEDAAVSSRPDALILFNPVLNFTGSPQLMERIGGDAKLAKAISPTLHLSRDAPPTLIFFGTSDRLFGQGDEFMKRAREVGANTHMDTTEGQPHGYFNRPPHREHTLRVADEFLQKLGYLKGAATICVPAQRN